MVLNALNRRLRNIKCMNMSDRSLWPDSLIYDPACPAVKNTVMCVKNQVFLRVVDGIKLWVNDQHIMFSVGYWIPQMESSVLWRWTHSFYFRWCQSPSQHTQRIYLDATSGSKLSRVLVEPVTGHRFLPLWRNVPCQPSLSE